MTTATRRRDRLPAFPAALAIAGAISLLLGRWGWPWDRVGNDPRGAFLAKYEVAAQAARELRLPLWNPYAYGGLPLLATASASMLYPPIVLAHLALPPRAALAAVSFFHLFVFFLGAALYLGRLGMPSWAGPFAALLAIGPILTAGSFAYPNKLACVAWVPFLLYTLRRALDGWSARWLGVFAIVSALQWLAGYPDFPMDTVVLLGVVTLAESRSRPVARLVLLAAGVLLGVAIALVQLLPLAEMVGESWRAVLLAGNDGARHVFRIQSAEHLWTLLVDARFGIAMLTLAILGGSLRAGAPRGWMLAFVWACFALNRPFSFLYALPPWSGSRIPLGWFEISPVFLGLLAANGVDRLRRRGGAWRAMALGAALLAIAGVGRTSFLPLATDAPDPRPSLGIEARAASLAEIVAAVAPDSRVVAWPEVREESFLRHRIRSPLGYEPAQLEPRRVAALLDSLGLRLLPRVDGPRGATGAIADHTELAARMGIGFVVAPGDGIDGLAAAGFAEIGSLPDGARVAHRPPVARARLVHEVVAVGDDAESLARIAAGVGDPASVAVLPHDDAATIALGAPPPGATERAVVVVDEPERLEVDVEAASPGLLVVRDTFYPGWRATVAGAPAPILRADHAFRGVAVPAGRTRVVLEYDPASVRIGAWASVFALVLALGLVVFG